MRRFGVAVGLLLFAAGMSLWLFAPMWDLALYHAFHIAASAHTLPLLVHLTDVGGAAVMIPFGLVAAGRLAIRKQYPRALWLVATVSSGRVIVELAKAMFARDRPAIADRLVSVSSASFPSSHSAGTMLTCVAICLALRAGRAGWTAAAMLIIAIGLSRIALGVHWPSDVVAGWGLGLFWVSALVWLLPTRTLPGVSASTRV